MIQRTTLLCLKFLISENLKIAKNKNGKCLSNIYINAQTKLTWQCNICNTKWNASPSNVARKDHLTTWCPTCAKNKNKEIIKKYELTTFITNKS